MQNESINKKISVIIPVYNMERYLDKCVESVLQQSYQDLEIILIDDGSTDSSGFLCDQLAAEHSCIRVIHKDNGGLSDARNAGIEVATGAYISFVDSDDYIAPDMLQKLYEAMDKNNADMSLCNVLFVDESGRALEKENQNLPITDEVLSSSDAIAKLMGARGWIRHLACSKLYKMSLFSDLRFPVSKLAEDAFVAHRLLGNCSKIACISDSCYYYVQRTGSIVHSKTAKTYLHDAESFLDRAIFCEELGMHRCSGIAYWQAAMFLPNIGRLAGEASELQAEYQETFALFRRNYRLCGYCTPKEKLQVAFVLLSPEFYRLFFRNSLRRQAKELRRKLVGKQDSK